MTDDDNEPDEIGSGEIESSLKNLIKELPAPPGGSLLKTILERRGIRGAIRRVYNDPLENYAQQHIFPDTPTDTYWELFRAANRHLRAKGQMDFFQVTETAAEIAEAEGKDTQETTSRHFALWADKMKATTGSFSIETAAARFIESADRLMMILNENQEMQTAAHAYAEAWHWFHMELYGEHELAAKGNEALQSLEAGRQARKDQGALKFGIIARAYADFASGEPNEVKRNSAKHAASAIIETVNKAFVEPPHEFKEIALGTLTNKMPEIIRDYLAQKSAHK
ncbi:hypothetical protein WN73_38565 [Bradyrhizobium sp. CCBAU 45394]|uniref:hypothetical protein n=1 Tax=Bradyrhizobium sp. CCBAU 45394 TaxID=1325087 RepID=UPI002302CAA8|nr:hypothetical protein [Bradyrhizobium sp. CCBAU 45394]MDA9396418.1 hypothetical protein [Bradyrhizobium sp. CCBAU 45394]